MIREVLLWSFKGDHSPEKSLASIEALPALPKRLGDAIPAEAPQQGHLGR